MLTIKSKIILSFSIVTGSILVILSFYLYRTFKEVELAKIDTRLESYAVSAANDLEESTEELPNPDPKSVVDASMKYLHGAHIQVMDQTGNIIVHDSVLGTTPSIGWQQSVKERRHFESITCSGTTYRSLWIPLNVHERLFFIVQVGLPLSEYEVSLSHFRFIIYLIIPFCLLLIGLAAYFITRIAFRPITTMVETANRITGQNLHERIKTPDSNDEVGLLAGTLNDMMQRIDAAFDSQKQFIADASHEIRTPLTVITSELEYAVQHSSEAAVRESIHTSLMGIDRLTKLTDDLLLLAKIDASQLHLNFQRVRLDELLLESVQLVNVIAGKKHIQLRVNIDEAVEIEADKDKIKSVILNLLDNAIKYSGDNTIVTASLSCNDSQYKTVSLKIEDQGSGIPALLLPNIFDRFYRIDASRSGTSGNGLGLAISRQLVLLHRGSISVQSEVNKGTTFIVKLPVAANKLGSE